jgi:hypothetical protein
MSVEQKMQFADAVEKIRFLQLAEPDVALSSAQKALLLASDHIQALERRNENFGDLYRKQEKVLESVMKFMYSLRQAYSVARTGTLVGEVTALGTTLRDLQRALGLEPDENEDGTAA